MKNVSAILRSLSFTDSECKTYLKTLENGPSTVIELTKITGLSRQATYLAIDELSQRGLMSSVQKEKKTLFAAESPERLISLVDSRLKEIETTRNDIKEIIEDLKLLQRGEKPIVKMFEGVGGLRTIQEDVLNTCPKNLYEIGNADVLYSHFPGEDFSSYQEGLKKRNIHVEAIVQNEQPYKKNEYASTHTISRNDFPFSGDILIYQDKTAISSLEGKSISILIESKTIAETMRALFHMALRGIKN